jgi:MFS-type transporter involved in bile tolerance (Atg22 family)
MGNCIAYTFKPAREEREAYGFIALTASRGPVVIFAALFASVALAAFAVSVSDCEGRILNGAVLASSILSALGVVEGVINGLISPLMGAYADLTPNRKPALLCTIMLFTVLVFVQGVMFISDPNGGPDPKANPRFNKTLNASSSNRPFLEVPLFQSDMALLLLCTTIVIQVAAYEMTAMLTGGYSAELTTDIALQSHYVSKSYMLLNLMQVGTVVVVFGLQTMLGLAPMQVGTYGAFATGLLTLMWFVPGAFWIGHRKEVSSEMDKRCCGLRHTGTMIKDINRQYSELNKFLIAWCTSSAAMSSITTLSTSYLTFHLGFGSMVTVLLGLALIFTVPGSWLAKPAMRKMGVKKSLILTNVSRSLTLDDCREPAPALAVLEPSLLFYPSPTHPRHLLARSLPCSVRRSCSASVSSLPQFSCPLKLRNCLRGRTAWCSPNSGCATPTLRRTESRPNRSLDPASSTLRLSSPRSGASASASSTPSETSFTRAWCPAAASRPSLASRSPIPRSLSGPPRSFSPLSTSTRRAPICAGPSSCSCPSTSSPRSSSVSSTWKRGRSRSRAPSTCAAARATSRLARSRMERSSRPVTPERTNE